ncbi:TENA/THI-4 protein [Candidatus Koribacter versatilis Ellin345]|uniref:TENA/THI-4 protein n=1 Tax=Koribacter versatilis (strain Ellin345) TaxID=204669 RepID=Q1IVL7_KORVE|nr:CADD family putative folate metabolism protein [Candidatus Koribacter versatilis]ABF39083.1 TENA/THI-4 protein [Candidatus Koribacter versatilis Ellin345]
METQQLLHELDAHISKYDLLCHPYYKAWSAGTLTREDLAAYAGDYYHHVAAFPAYLSAFHSRLEDGETRRTVLRNLADEEISGRAHSDIWLDFAAGMGADCDTVRSSQPMDSVANAIAWFRNIAATGTRAEALAAFYAYESQVPRVAEEKSKGLKERYGADRKTCGYFDLHKYADVEHSRVWGDLLAQELEAHPEQREAALAASEQAAKVLWEVLDGMEARRMTVV